jgi:ABC-type Mn2+/Zn2+ transport system permease subunit
MAFLGDALAHAILPGVAVGYLLGGSNPLWLSGGALVAGVITALGIGSLSKSGIKEDTAIGVMFTGMFALGIALISTVRSYTVDLTHFLFGNVLGVATSDLWLIGIFGGLVILTILAFYKEFLVISFDPVLAKTLRLPTNFLNYLLLLLIAVTIVVSLQTVGIALMAAMLVTPAATAYLLTRRLPIMMALAATIGAISAVTGLYLSFYINIASGPAIVLVCTAAFLLAFVFSPRQGIIKRSN